MFRLQISARPRCCCCSGDPVPGLRDWPAAAGPAGQPVLLDPGPEPGAQPGRGAVLPGGAAPGPGGGHTTDTRHVLYTS